MSTPVAIDNPICVALDSDDGERVRSWARATRATVGMYKVGLTAYIAHGASLVAELAAERPVFLDLKLHDIPAQVEGAARAAAATGASFVTAHASGGPGMVAAAVSGAGSDTNILAVTVLTSLSAEDLNSLGIERSPADLVMKLAHTALDAGAAGLVCSPHEVAALRARFGARAEGGPLLVVPGIREVPTGDDQRRTMSAKDTVAAGADIVVIGRPITASEDPAGAARAILEGLG